MPLRLKRTTNLRSFWITTEDTSKRLEKDYTSERDYDLWFLIRTITVLPYFVGVVIFEYVLHLKG
jgi:hypothetical protein